MTRHEIREAAFLALFQFEFYPEDFNEQVHIFLVDDKDYPSEIADEIAQRLDSLAENIKLIDKYISDASQNWTIERMNKVDLTLLRLATYEMKFEDLDAGIAINEAIELAKEYGTDESGGFVNGVMGRIAKA